MNKEEERVLLDKWHLHISNAMQQLHLKFNNDSKFILTESDLKCWLFFYLQQEKPYIPFAVHTEVTHYAPHIEKEKVEKKHKFRDLSLLCPWELKANEDLLKQDERNKELLSKGFLHRAPAIHFELKFIRENGTENQIQGLKTDIEKLNNYHPNNDSHIRDFVIVCGSRSINTTVEILANELDKIEDRLKDRVRFYLFDTDKILSFKHENGKFKETFKGK